MQSRTNPINPEYLPDHLDPAHVLDQSVALLLDIGRYLVGSRLRVTPLLRLEDPSQTGLRSTLLKDLPKTDVLAAIRTHADGLQMLGPQAAPLRAHTGRRVTSVVQVRSGWGLRPALTC